MLDFLLVEAVNRVSHKTATGRKLKNLADPPPVVKPIRKEENGLCLSNTMKFVESGMTI